MKDTNLIYYNLEHFTYFVRYSYCYQTYHVMAVGFLLMICAGILLNYYSSIEAEMSNFQFNAIAIAFVAIVLNELYGFWDRAAPKIMAKWVILMLLVFCFIALFGLSFHPGSGEDLYAMGLKVKACYAILNTTGVYYIALGARSFALNLISKNPQSEISN